MLYPLLTFLLLTASSFPMSRFGCLGSGAQLTEEAWPSSRHSRWLRGTEPPELPRSGAETELPRSGRSMGKCFLVTSAMSFGFPKAGLGLAMVRVALLWHEPQRCRPGLGSMYSVYQRPLVQSRLPGTGWASFPHQTTGRLDQKVSESPIPCAEVWI